MYKKILVPLDGTEVAESVIQFIEELAAPPAEVVLVRVAAPVEHDVLGESGRLIPMWEQTVSLETSYEHYLDREGASLRRKGMKVTTEVRFGQASKEIVRAAVAHKVDLIAMSSHGRTRIGRLIHGSVSGGVLRSAPVPVLIVNTSKAAEAAKAAAA